MKDSYGNRVALHGKSYYSLDRYSVVYVTGVGQYMVWDHTEHRQIGPLLLTQLAAELVRNELNTRP